jgi:glycosyltransferase involved in cell wall biosynthesis
MASFSVLMANYNNGCYIDDAIRSVLSQTFTDWELIIIDDCSTDDSVERLQSYLSDQRIRLYLREKNEGYTRALIYGLSQISSNIVGILDSDDALMPTAIEKVYGVHTQRPELGLVLSQVVICDESLKPLYAVSTPIQYLREPMLWMRGPTSFRVFKLGAYYSTTGLATNILYAEDWDLIFKLEEVAPTTLLEEPLYMHRELPLSQSKEATKQQVSLRSLALSIYHAYLRRRLGSAPNLPRFVVCSWLIAGVRFSLELGEWSTAFSFAVRALRVAPFFAASYRALRQAVRGPIEKLLTVISDGDILDRRFLPVRAFQSGFQSNTGNIEPDRIECIPLFHRRGHALFGGDQLISQDGNYRVTFELKVEPFAFAQDPVVVLDVFENLQTMRVLAERAINRNDAGGGLGYFSLRFAACANERVEFRVFWCEQCVLTIHGVIMERLVSRSTMEDARQI